MIFNFRRDVKVSSAMGENSDRMTQISHNPIPPSPPPPPLRRLCNILTIPHIGGKPLYLPRCTLLATIESVKKYKIAPKSGKNNGNFLRSTRITLRGSSYSPLYDIKNQDDLLRQGKQLHTNCIIKVSKVNCMMII